MSRTYSDRTRPRPQPVCKKHPGVPAVRDGKCASCLHYDNLGKRIADKATAAADPSAATKK